MTPSESGPAMPTDTADDGFSNEDLEDGRLLFRRPWQFVTSVAHLHQLPDEGPIEIAFAGRSNVGKSSLINALTGVKGLARTSNTPGRTQMLNFFAAPDSPVALVDMPGYGYAQAPKTQVEAWTDLVFTYLQGRSRLRRVFVLIDSRHGLKANDLEVMDLLDRAAVSYQVVLTKGDKIKPPQLNRVADETLKGIQRRPAAFPTVLSTSSEKGSGLADLRATILVLSRNG